MTDVLLRLADKIDSQAAISSRSGQLADLERIATELRAERDRLHSWAGLMALLDEHYPADVFTGASGDLGPRVVALIRECDVLRTRDRAHLIELHDIERALAEALGYPKDAVADPNSPCPGEYVTGDHTACTLAIEAARELARLKTELDARTV